MEEEGEVSLALVPDSDQTRDISLIKVERMAHSFVQSEYGYKNTELQFVSEEEDYILIVISMKPVETKLMIKIEACDYFTDLAPNKIEIQQLFF